MKQVLYHWFCFLQDEKQTQTVREVWYLDNNTVQYRSNDADGETRYYNHIFAHFEKTFKVNFAELIFCAK